MLSLKIYQQRRARLLDSLPENSCVCVYSGEEQIRNRDVEYDFRPRSDFWYLTGFEEPESILVLRKVRNGQQLSEESWLFLRPKDPEQETWQGRRLGVEAAPETLAVDQAYEIAAIDEKAREFLAGVEQVYVSFSEFAEWSEHFAEWLAELKPLIRQGVAVPTQLSDLDAILHEQRLIKSEEEIALMRQAAQITVQGHLAAMRSIAQLKTERQLQAEVEYTFKHLESPRVAFSTIAACGENACILHYTENSDTLKAGELVLVDAGAEFAGYAGDITTTFPVSGQFSSAQSALYQWVLKAQQAVIEKIRPGVRYDALHQTSCRVLTQGLMALGILQGDLETLLKEEAYKPYFMHGTGHWLGMDVHDVGAYKLKGEWRTLEPGMVLTVEPGLYISPEQTAVAEQWRGIGIRIEDDVLVTESGCEVLTQGLPRTVEEIEHFMEAHR
ncbi:aminopeptidase P N-terminal domain-containing protein [Galenea microaerophila]